MHLGGRYLYITRVMQRSPAVFSASIVYGAVTATDIIGWQA